MFELEKRLARFGIKPGLERMRAVCEATGNPQNKMQVILVTGTNGKGSTTSFLASILKQAGHKVGAYYSPHLFKYNERFKINGKDISDRELKKYTKEILKYAGSGYELTLFEALTVIAYKYFADKDCDFAIMEIGMGGKYDATNIANEVASIITNVDLEHTEYLGDTIEKIAEDKAGIIKTASIVATAASGKALEAIKKVAEGKKIQLDILGNGIFIDNIKTTSKEVTFTYLGSNIYPNLRTKLLGDYQAKNAALAICIAEAVSFDVNEKAIRNGLLKAKNPGRMQVISGAKKPLILVDAAHNAHGIKELIVNLNIFNYHRLICIFGCMKDKDWQEMLRFLSPHCDHMITTQIKDERATDCNSLAEFASGFCNAIAVSDPKRALAQAKKQTKQEDMLLICGSIYMIGKITESGRTGSLAVKSRHRQSL